MSISTKTGDQGQTSLFSGERVWKNELRVRAYGALDELDAWLGDALHLVEDSALKELLQQAQQKLYLAMAELANTNINQAQTITTSDVEAITSQIKTLEKEAPLKGLVLPGSMPQSARLDICRTVARRAEREIVALSRETEVSPQILQYVNRLSDLLFILARVLETRAGVIRYADSPNTTK